VNQIPAPVLYVSPTQVNFQLPYGLPPGIAAILVANGNATSASVQVPISRAAPGVYTLSGGRCGPAAAVVYDPKGNIFVNSEQRSASPGDVVAVFGTGFGPPFFDPPAPGTPAPDNPLLLHSINPSVVLGEGDQMTGVALPEFRGLAPGLVGVDQINFRLPENTPPGCRVPLRIASMYFHTQTTYLAVRSGGGVCVPSPKVQLGEVRWTSRSVSGPEPGQARKEEWFTASFSEGESASLARARYPAPGFRSAASERTQPACGGYTGSNLDAGRLSLDTARGSFAVEAERTVWGEYRYRQELPTGAIGESVLRARAQGAGPVGPFASEVRPAAPIRILTDLSPGRVFRNHEPLTISWSGGSKDVVVAIRVVSFSFPGGERAETGLETLEPGDSGSATILPMRLLPSGPPVLPIPAGAGVVVTIKVLPAVPATIRPDGIRLGVQEIHEQIWEFHGLTIG
jgi:uncharacterized protein (TIGR03437 family)